jgi:Glycosyl hydrolases family 38 N-terminal domain/Glycosyl hydrolases family 38 C-terminal domain
MTTRLLSQSGQAPGSEAIDEALIKAALAVAVDADGTTVSISSLPLFRNAAGGGLEQVVRVHVAPANAPLERVVLTGPGGVVAEAAGPLPESGDLDLFVPELTAPETWQVSVVLAGVSHSAGVTLVPQRKLTVHLVHHSHLDIGYTDTQGIVLRNHLEYLDAAVELGRQGDGADPSTRFRWAIESNFPVRTWISERSEATVKEFARLAQEDVLEVTAMPFNLHTEAATQEELARLLRTTIELRERYGIPILSAMHTDVPGATPGWVDALYEAGVRYLSAAHNWAGRSVPYYVGGQDLGRPFWWRTPAGSKLLTWFTDSAHGMAYMEGNLVGLSVSYARAMTLLPLYLSALINRPFPYSERVFGLAGIPEGYAITKQPYPHDIVHLRVQGDHSDNACPNITPAEIARRWNDQWAYPRLVTSTNTGFFTEAERTLGSRLETHTGDWGDWWADGMGSGARPLGYNRRAQNLVRAGETVHLLADLRSGEPHPVRDTVDGIYDKTGLFDEHTWGAANPWHDHEHGANSGGLQWARKSEFAHQAYDDAQDLVHAAVRRLGAALVPSPDGLASLAVHNTTGHPRTDLVQVFVPESVVNVAGSLTAVDARTGAQVPTRLTAKEGWLQAASPRGWLVEFVATDVPAMGWARYDLVAIDERAVAVERTEAFRLSNEFFEVTYDPKQALISSIVDLRTGRELVNPEALAGVNEYIYDTYGTAPHVNHLSSRVQARDLSLFTSRAVGRNAVVLRSETTPLGEELEVEVHAPGVDWIRTTISLLRRVPRVDIVNRLSKLASPTKESVYFAFPLAGSSAPAAFELTGSVDGRDVPHVPGAPQHMRALRHWVGLRDADGDYTTAWATLEAPLVQFETIHLPYQPFPSTITLDQPEPSTVYSWALNNIWDTNFPAQQQGEMTFRYAISGSADEPPHRLGPETAEGLTDPLVAVLALASDGGGAASVAASGSLLSVDHPDVIVTSLGHPLDGSAGVSVRMRSLAASPVTAVVTLDGYAASAAEVTTLLELSPSDVPVVDGTVAVELPPGASRTVVLRP